MADWNQIEKEFDFSTSRSSGAGGQHVNKVETQVRVCFSIDDSLGLTDEEKTLILERLANKVDKEHKICISRQQFRSQVKNKEEAVKKMIKMIEKALIPPKKRKKTRVPSIEKQKRLEEKKNRARIKELRKKPKIKP